jgi:hypothetical protein
VGFAGWEGVLDEADVGVLQPFGAVVADPDVVGGPLAAELGAEGGQFTDELAQGPVRGVRVRPRRAAVRRWQRWRRPRRRAGRGRPGRFDATTDLDGVPAGYQDMADRRALKVLVEP